MIRHPCAAPGHAKPEVEILAPPYGGIEQAGIQIKYNVYIEKEKELVKRMSQLEDLLIPETALVDQHGRRTSLAELTGATGVGGMVGGQYVDVTAPGDLEPAGLRRLHELKTGRLIAASVDCVPILYGLGGPATIALGRFAAELGVLFQIVDDILDVTGEEAALGKPQGSDERHGKLTYVSVFGLERARELATESHRKAREALADSGFETETLDRITDYILTRTS